MAIGRYSPSVAGACVVRDARDIIPSICGHYLRVGPALIAFIDVGSTDGTFEFLSSWLAYGANFCTEGAGGSVQKKISSACSAEGSITSPIIVSGATSTQVARAGVILSFAVPDND